MQEPPGSRRGQALCRSALQSPGVMVSAAFRARPATLSDPDGGLFRADQRGSDAMLDGRAEPLARRPATAAATSGGAGA